jgi:hypothetical protein
VRFVFTREVQIVWWTVQIVFYRAIHEISFHWPKMNRRGMLGIGTINSTLISCLGINKCGPCLLLCTGTQRVPITSSLSS